MDGFLSVLTTIDGAEAGRALARALVEAQLVACAQLVPIESIYRWEGKVEDAREILLVCKIRAADYAAVEAAILARHPTTCRRSSPCRSSPARDPTSTGSRPRPSGKAEPSSSVDQVHVIPDEAKRQ